MCCDEVGFDVPLYYTVIHVASDLVSYRGSNLHAAAEYLTPGHVFGKGSTQELADYNAGEEATIARARIKRFGVGA